MMPKPPLPSLSCTTDAAATIGPVAHHRITQIRRRIRDGRYAIDSMALASEICRFDRPEPIECLSLAPTVNRLLAVAIDRLEEHSALVLQLEFVEQLSAREIAATVGIDADTLAIVRSAGLLKLKALFDAGSCHR